MAVINKMIKENEMSIKWTEESKRLADPLTKGGVSTVKLSVKLQRERFKSNWLTIWSYRCCLMVCIGLH